MFSILCVLISVAYAALSSVHGAVLNVNPLYGNWPKLFPTDTTVRIPVFIETVKYGTDLECVSRIRSALGAMNTGFPGCVSFFELQSNVNVGREFLWITNTVGAAGTTVPTTCASVPGKMTQASNQGQRLVILNGAGRGACCGTVRDIMRYLANTLGLRNEYQRPDRDFYLLVNTLNIDPVYTFANPTALYTLGANGVVVFPNVDPTATPIQNGPFDFNSITMVAPNRYGSGTTAVWSSAGGLPSGAASSFPPLPAEGNVTGQPLINQISYWDCAAVSSKYGCATVSSSCFDAFGQSQNG